MRNEMEVEGATEAGGLQCRVHEGKEVRTLSNSTLSSETSVSRESRRRVNSDLRGAEVNGELISRKRAVASISRSSIRASRLLSRILQRISSRSSMRRPIVRFIVNAVAYGKS
jgi:hypothetical protein